MVEIWQNDGDIDYYDNSNLIIQIRYMNINFFKDIFS